MPNCSVTYMAASVSKREYEDHSLNNESSQSCFFYLNWMQSKSYRTLPGKKHMGSRMSRVGMQTGLF